MATTADYLNNLVIQKNALVDNLVTKGVNATHDELLDTLVPKVLEISGQSGGDIANPDTIYYALKNAGYDVTNDPNTWSDTIKAVYKDYDYRLDYSGTIFVYGGHTVTRSTDKLAYCGWCTFNNGYFMSVLISAYPEALVINMNGAVPPEYYESTFDGETVHWTVCGENSTFASDSSGYNRRYLGSVNSYDGYEDMIRHLYNEIKMCGYSLYE